jgi:diguanylate cyclase (GGDEF)-like protein/PAS domain S-box-containing protein
MSSRNAAPSVNPDRSSSPRNRARPDDPRRSSGALAVLETLRRDSLLQAVATAAQELLRPSDLAISLPKAIERIGQAVDIDRAHIFLIDTPGAKGNILQHFVWCAPGLATPPEFQNVEEPQANVGLKSWIAALEAGETIVGHVRDFDLEKRAFFALGGVKSVLAVPVFADGQWLGVIGFDDCRSERNWAAAEIDTIKTVAELVGAAVARAAHLKTLDDANRIIENSPTILFRTAAQYPYPLTYVSQNIRQYGYQADQFLTDPLRWGRLIDSDDLPIVLAGMRSISEGETNSYHAEFRLHRPDGSMRWVAGHGSALRDGGGGLVAIEGILTDITDVKRSEDELAYSHNLLTTAVESSPDAILVVDATDRVTMYNKHFIDLWGVPEKLLHTGVDKPILKHVASQMKNEREFTSHVRHLYDHPEIQSHEELETADGRIIERDSRSLYSAKKKYLGRVWFFRDTTEKKRAAEKIAELARTDSLTGLANRAAFLERLNLEFAHARRGGHQFAVHYLDLDHFKDVNDTLGHPVGDDLLRLVAERLKACVRETDLVARFGGDEFAVLQDVVANVGNVETLAVKIGTVLAAPFTIDGNQIHTTVSIGIVPYRSDVAGVDAMMMKADLALYRAKNEGRNRFRVHVAELDDVTRRRMMIGEDLRHAVARGELELYYQPQVEIASGEIAGLEALIRWNHPKFGMLLPAAFIPVAETTGSIVPIGEWVIGEACRQIQDWNKLGLTPPIVGFNLSGAQFKLATQIDRIVAENLARHGVMPKRLELEITESVLIETTQRHGETFERLRNLGVRLAIDDFGTGYSSLDYLRSFHVCRLKIDRSFIANVCTSADDAAIVRATIGLAHELGMDVVAEGVETAGQRDFLRAAGCRFAQGYFFGRPMPVSAATERLAGRPQDAA